jgi:hypothetical protein
MRSTNSASGGMPFCSTSCPLVYVKELFQYRKSENLLIMFHNLSCRTIRLCQHLVWRMSFDCQADFQEVADPDWLSIYGLVFPCAI